MESSPSTSSKTPNNGCSIKNVWRFNLHEEFQKIRQVVQKYRWVAMDTEFPGIVALPLGYFSANTIYEYHKIKCNVNLLKLIQLGLTFMDENGNTPPGTTTWQFNFQFNLGEDTYAWNSVDLLIDSGIQFLLHCEFGINPVEFAELIMTSGLVLMDNVTYLSFHSGYDFGYMIKLLTGKNLPLEEQQFFSILKIYFPNIYDVKYLMNFCKDLAGGLQSLADQLRLLRVGQQHQAGSDSHLTGLAFFKLKQLYFENSLEKTKGYLYGLGEPHVRIGNTSVNSLMKYGT